MDCRCWAPSLHLMDNRGSSRRGRLVCEYQSWRVFKWSARPGIPFSDMLPPMENPGCPHGEPYRSNHFQIRNANFIACISFSIFWEHPYDVHIYSYVKVFIFCFYVKISFSLQIKKKLRVNPRAHPHCLQNIPETWVTHLGRGFSFLGWVRS